MRLPYNKKTAQTYVYASPEFYASQCYIVAIQDVRGQYASQGVFYAFQNEMQDGYDSVEWAASLPGSNGKVGMYGLLVCRSDAVAGCGHAAAASGRDLSRDDVVGLLRRLVL
jgi:hypothetical protein